MSEEQDRAMIEELSKILWTLERKGYIFTYEEDEEAEVAHWREIAREAVRRARTRLGLPEFRHA
jgi:hypothetical protein